MMAMVNSGLQQINGFWENVIFSPRNGYSVTNIYKAGKEMFRIVWRKVTTKLKINELPDFQGVCIIYIV